MKKQLLPIRSPQNAVHIVTQDRILKRLAVTHIHGDDTLHVEIVDQQIGCRIGRARFGIGFRLESIVEIRQIAKKEEIPDSAFIETIKGDFVAIG